MKKVKIIRCEVTDNHTLGVLLVEGEIFCYTLELAYRNNETNISCIPYGEYVVEFKRSPKFGYSYAIINVVDRVDILFHRGNTVDDTNGCILLGYKTGYIDNKRAILDSKKSVEDFMKNMEKEMGFNLEILEV